MKARPRSSVHLSSSVISWSSCERSRGAFIRVSPLFLRCCVQGKACARVRTLPVCGHVLERGVLSGRLVLQYAAADLVELDRFEQCAEVAFTEALVALA